MIGDHELARRPLREQVAAIEAAERVGRVVERDVTGWNNLRVIEWDPDAPPDDQAAIEARAKQGEAERQLEQDVVDLAKRMYPDLFQPDPTITDADEFADALEQVDPSYRRAAREYIKKHPSEAAKISERAAQAREKAVAKMACEGPARTSWWRIDLTDALHGGDIEPPTMMARRDGKHLLYTSRTHFIQGEPEALKGWFAQAATVEVLRAGGNVGYIDMEDDERGVVARLRALGVPDEAFDRLTYIRPEEPLYDRHGTPTQAAIDLIDLLNERAYDLTIIDGVTESMTVEGLSLLDNADIARWNRRLARRIAETGSAVLCVDHVVKSREQQGRYAIGGQHKLAGVTGAAYSFQVLRPLARATSVPVEALVKITVVKDRPGHVRAHATSDVVAIMAVTSYPDGGVTVHLDAPGNNLTEPDPALRRQILEYLATYDGSSGRQIEAAVEGKGEAIRHALRWLHDHEMIRVEQKGRSHLHYLTLAGTDALT